MSPIRIAWYLLLLSAGSVVTAVEPLARAHAHNDYLHPRPLLDALGHGFRSIEADIWWTNGLLLVGHDAKDLNPSVTFEGLYLRPLKHFVQTNASDSTPITVLIDVKTDAESSYKALSELLRRYSNMLTRFEKAMVHTNRVTAVISGNRAVELMANERERFAAVDGRFTNLTNNHSVSLYPLVSDNWNRHFKWRGEGTLPEEERSKLRSIVSLAHAQHRKIRLWAVPDHERAWRELLDAGVDFINTDRLRDLEKFLRSENRP